MSIDENVSTESRKTEQREKDNVCSIAYLTEEGHVDYLVHKECTGTSGYSSWHGNSRHATGFDVNLSRERPYSEHSERGTRTSGYSSWHGISRHATGFDVNLSRERPYSEHSERGTRTSNYSSWQGNSRDATSFDVNFPRERPYSEHNEQGCQDNSRDITSLDTNLPLEITSSEHNEQGNPNTDGSFTEEDVQTSGKPTKGSTTKKFPTLKSPNEVQYQGSVKKGLYIQNHRKITNNFRYLKSELAVEYFCDCFYRDGYFSDFDMEDIRAKKARYKKVDIFLRKLLRLKPEAYELFLQYLDEAGYTHVRKVLERPVNNQVQMWQSQGVEQSKRLKQCKEEFLDQLEPDVITDSFVECGEFTIDEYEEIIEQETRRKKSEAIYNLLLKHKERAYFVLLEALGKNGGDFLARVLTAGNDMRPATKSSEEKGEMKITQSRVKVRESTRTTAFLKDSEELELKVTLKNCTGVKRIELEMIKEMDKCDVKVSINDNLIMEEQCSATSFKLGSIIITLRRCRPDSFQRLFGTGVQDPVLHLLQHIFLHADIRKLLPWKEVQLDLELRCIPPKLKEKTSDTDVIETHLDFLVEELDALTFITPLKNQGVLSEIEADMILEATPPSRATRTKTMLKIIQEKKEEDIFISILEKENKHVWEHINESKNKRSVVPLHSLVTSYQKLADNMNPDIVVGECCVKEYMPMDSLSGWSRENRAKFILQQVMMRDKNTRVRLLNLLSFRDQIPPDILTIGGKDNVKNGHVSPKKRAAKQVTEMKRTRPVVVFAAEFIIKEIPVAAVLPDTKHSLGALPMSFKGAKHPPQKRTNTSNRATMTVKTVTIDPPVLCS